MKKRQERTFFPNPLARLMPLPQKRRDALVLRAYTALDSLNKGKEADVDAWRDVADVVNVTETLAVHIKKLDTAVTVYTRAANEAMRVSQDRYKAGQALRLDEDGVNAVRVVIALYEQCLELMTEKQVEEAFKRTVEEVRKHIAAGGEVVEL
jgi:hypothetical protein